MEMEEGGWVIGSVIGWVEMEEDGWMDGDGRGRGWMGGGMVMASDGSWINGWMEMEEEEQMMMMIMGMAKMMAMMESDDDTG